MAGNKGGGKGSGGNPPSGGGSPRSGSVGTPSGGGGRQASSPPAPTPGPKPPSSPTGGGGSAQSAPAQAVNVAKAFQSGSPSSSSSQQKEKKQERVETLTTKAKGLISGATASGIADPGKFKDILGKLKDLGKEKRVESLQTQKKTAVTSARDAAAAANKPTTYSQEDLDKAIQDALSKAGSSGLTQEDLDKALAGVQQTGLTQEDLDTALSRYSSQNAPQTNASDTGSAATGTSEFDDWVKSFESQQDVGAFDPDLFRNLLGELESSKRRQKDWSERSARAAYGY